MNKTGKKGKEETMKSKSFKPKKKQRRGKGKAHVEYVYDIDLENMEPWSPTTDVWESDVEDFLDPAEFDKEEGETYSDYSASEANSEFDDEQWDSIGSKMKKAISGSYMYRYYCGDGDESDPEGFYQYRIPELNLIAFKAKSHQIVKPEGRLAMKNQILIDRAREKCEYALPRGSYLRCAEGGNHLVESFSRRLQYGPFLYCPVSHLQCALFEGFNWNRKKKRSCAIGMFEVPRFRRPPFRKFKRRFPRFGRMRSDPLVVDCKGCSRFHFTHHGDPDMHYQDYINLVQYQGSNPDASRATFRRSVWELIKKMRSEEEKKPKKKKVKKAVTNDDSPASPGSRTLSKKSTLLNDTVATLSKKKEIVSPSVTDEIPFNLYSKYSPPSDNVVTTPVGSGNKSKYQKSSTKNVKQSKPVPLPSTSASAKKTTNILPIPPPTPRIQPRPRPTSSTSLPTPRPGSANTIASRPETPFQFCRPNSTLFNDTIASSRRKTTVKKRKPKNK